MTAHKVTRRRVTSCRHRLLAAALGGLAVGVMVMAVAVAGMGPLCASACAASPSESPSEGTVLRIGVTEDLDNMNPFIGYTETAYEVYSQNYEFLVEKRPDDFMPGSDGVAESWESSPDGKTWTFHLHEGITWQDGKPLTADDVAFTYNYIIDNEMPAFASSAAGIVKAVKVDDYTVKLITRKPKSNILRLWIPILPKHIWEKIPPEAAKASFKNASPVGSGPFRVVEWKRGSYIRMVANKDYRLGAPAIDELIFVIYRNPSTMIDDLRAGLIGAAQNVPVAEFKKLQGEPGIEAISYSFFNWDYLNYNCYTGAASMGHPVLKDPRFRVALDHAIDREKLASIAYGGEAAPGTTILPPDSWQDPDFHWQPAAGVLRAFDLEKARSLLDEAGYTDADGDGLRDYEGKPIRLRLWALTQSVQNQSAGKLITGWFRDLGLDITFEVVDEGVYNERIWNYKGDVYAPDFDMYLWFWYGFSDPGQTLGSYTTSQIEGWNEPCWSSKAYDAAFDAQATQIDAGARKADVDACQEIMYAENPQSITVYPKLLQAINTAKWDGWIFNTVGGGQAFFRSASQKSYLTVKPATAVESAGTSSSWTWAVVAAAGAAVAILSTILVRRRRHRAEED